MRLRGVVTGAAAAATLLLALMGCGPDGPAGGSGEAARATGTCLAGPGGTGAPGGTVPSGTAAQGGAIAGGGTVPGDTAASSGSAGPGTGAAAGPGTGGVRLPDIELACFDGSGTVRIGDLSGPAVVNLWASWCPPCIDELPAFQRLAGRAAGKVAVIGVNTSDARDAAQSTIDEMGLGFPMLVDDRRQLLVGVGRSGLPATLFVDADGRIAFVYNTDPPLDDASLDQLVAQHLGLALR